MAISSKGYKRDNFEPHNSLNIPLQIFKTFVLIFFNVNPTLNQTPDILALCETNLDDSIDSGNFSLRGCLPLVQKGSVTHICGLTVYVKIGLPFAPGLS